MEWPSRFREWLYNVGGKDNCENIFRVVTKTPTNKIEPGPSEVSPGGIVERWQQSAVWSGVSYFELFQEYFTELKSFLRRHWSHYESDTEQGFDVFLEWCINVVGAKEESARGHFRYEGLKIEDFGA